jgi:hypothetical protein
MTTPLAAPRTTPSEPITKKASNGLSGPGTKRMQPMNPKTKMAESTLMSIVAHHQPTALLTCPFRWPSISGRASETRIWNTGE